MIRFNLLLKCFRYLVVLLHFKCFIKFLKKELSPKKWHSKDNIVVSVFNSKNSPRDPYELLSIVVTTNIGSDGLKVHDYPEIIFPIMFCVIFGYYNNIRLDLSNDFNGDNLGLCGKGHVCNTTLLWLHGEVILFQICFFVVWKFETCNLILL